MSVAALSLTPPLMLQHHGPDSSHHKINTSIEAKTITSLYLPLNGSEQARCLNSRITLNLLIFLRSEDVLV